MSIGIFAFGRAMFPLSKLQYCNFKTEIKITIKLKLVLEHETIFIATTL
jgi:hypothetical protein